MFADPLAVPALPTAAIVEEVVRSIFDRGTRQDGRLTEAALSTYLRPWIGAGGSARFARSLQAIDGSGLEGRDDELSAIGFPVLILWGEDDPFLPASLGERLNDAIASSTLGLLPGCGHFLTEDAPETIFPMISEYLRARFSMEPHGHGDMEGVVMLQLERRPPWVDVADDEDDDWFDVPETDEDGED
jgi:pimeloyl-ACP methyl ester carboxylesterase